MLKIMPVWMPKTPPAWIVPVPDYEMCWTAAIKACASAFPKNTAIDGAPAEINTLWSKGTDWLKAQGAEIVESHASHQICAPHYYIVAPQKASSNLARYDGSRFGHPREACGHHRPV